MSNSNLVPKPRHRTDLYYGLYRYCLRGYQAEFHCLRELSHARIDNIMGARREWGRKIQLRQPGSWYWAALDITEQDVANLHSMCDFLLEDDRERKLVIAGSWFYFYTNDFDFVRDVMALSWLDQDRLELTQVELFGQPDTIVRHEPRHRMRSYLRSMILDDRKREILGALMGQQEQIRLSPSLKQWIDHPRWNRIMDHHFIDHDDSSILTLLALIEPRLIRKTVLIVKRA